MERLVQLLVTSGPDKGRTFFIKPKREALIGRAVACDLRLSDPGASQRHCVVRCAGDLAFIEDLESRNGTLVNGERTDHRVLDQNGKLQIGSSIVDVSFVTTERPVPIGSLPQVDAPTVFETAPSLQPVGKPASAIPSTVLDASQLKDFRAARGLLGKTVGEYLLLETLGVGDVGIVFRAKHIKQKDEVALAVIPATTVKAPELLPRMIAETKVQLTIPHSLKLLAAGVDGDYGFIATEMVKGRDLESVLEAGRRFAADKAIEIMQPIFEALIAAHAQGLIHGDVRPANILLGEHDQALLLGLGLGPQTDHEGKTIFVRKDETAARLGFTAPELTLAKPAVDASDVFSLGATLYHLLSGQRPFSAPKKLELVRKIRWEDLPRLSELNKDIPAALAKVIEQAMSKEVQGRYPSMAAFRNAARDALKT